MHPALRKGPLFYKKKPTSTFFQIAPPFSAFLYKKTHPHFISCQRVCVRRPLGVFALTELDELRDSACVLCT